MGAYKRRAPGTIKEATNDLIEAAGGQVKAADLTGWTRQYLFDYTDEGERNASRTMPVGLVRTLETHVGDPILTRFLAAEQGYLLLKLPEAETNIRLLKDLQELSKAFAVVVDEIAQAMDRDGRGGEKITAFEAGRILAAYHDVMEAISGPVAAMMARRDGEGR